MPAGCLPKRPSDVMESSQDGSSSSAPKVKLPRLEKGPEEFSQVVKNKLQTYTRTGQACDRCKVRKIRCDALPEGCSHCIQQSLDCYVTDRVTGRTERRGYLQQLEREKNDMLTRLRDMEKLLEDKGVQVRPWKTTPAYESAQAFDSQDDSNREQWSQSGSLWIKDTGQSGQKPSSGYSAGNPSPPPTMDARTVDARLGVAADHARLSSISGTQLSILGMTIDVTSFDAPDMEGQPSGTPNSTPLYNKSLQSFYNSSTKAQPLVEALLPSREDAFNYSEWFFIITGAFVPILHKPTYLKLLTRIYDDPTFKPCVAEMCIVHMVFALMYYQFGVRNGEGPERKAQLNNISNNHYHWCLNKTHDLLSDFSITSVQALVLIATHCRGFPKPGPAYHMAGIAWSRAMELNLHRAYLKKGVPTNLENEMRKRAWWCILMLVVTLNGRIGKPMPIRSEDFDTELPVCVPDDYITEDGIIDVDQTKEKECFWLVGLAGFKISNLFLDLWNNIYSVRQDPKKYIASIRQLEQQYRDYENEIPVELKLATCKPQDQVIAGYLEATNCEFLLCLRHPSRCITNDPEFIAENYRVSEDSARKLLRTANELARLKSLDTTWYQMAVFVAAVFTILAARWERRHNATPADFVSLRADMKVGLSVINELTKYIGVGPDCRLMPQISSIVDRTMTSIRNAMGAKQGNDTPTAQSQSLSHQFPSGNFKQDGYNPTIQAPSNRSASSTPTRMANGAEPSPAIGNTSYYNGPMVTSDAVYPQMGYAELGQPSIATSRTGTHNIQPSYMNTTGQSPHQYIYATSAAASAAAAAQMTHHNTPGGSPQPVSAAHNPMVAYSTQSAAAAHSNPTTAGGDWLAPPTGHHGISTNAVQQQQSHASQGGNPWHEWANAIALVDPSSQDRFSANALLAMNSAGGQGGPGAVGGAGLGVGVPDVGVAVTGVPSDHAAQWPLSIYNPNVSGNQWYSTQRSDTGKALSDN